MEEKTTKIAAITAAVTGYIQEEEKARVPVSGITPSMGISPWKLFGRRESMRTLVRRQPRKTGGGK